MLQTLIPLHVLELVAFERVEQTRSHPVTGTILQHTWNTKVNISIWLVYFALIYTTFIIFDPCSFPQLDFTWKKINRIKEKRFVKIKNENGKMILFFFSFSFFNFKNENGKTNRFCFLFNTLHLSNSLNRQDPFCLCVSTIQFSVGKKNYNRKKKRVVFPCNLFLVTPVWTHKGKRLDFRFLSTEDPIPNV